jgi:filamentous hemagglutinin family protein
MMERRCCRSLLELSTAGSLLVMLFLSCLPAEAGDLLRGGARGGGSTGSGIVSGSGAQASAPDSLHVNAQDRLARTSQALQDVRAMQQAARQEAHSTDLQTKGLGFNGLGVSGLNRDSTRWTGAQEPRVNGADLNDITILQQAQQAMLYWNKFNVGRETTLTFDQSAGGDSASQWIAFNKIDDPTHAPSQILGKIRSIGPDGTPATGGQVYIINPNGIIFHGSAQVDTHALVASSLPINDNLVARGLLNNPDQQFLFSGLALDKKDDFDPTLSLPADGRYGEVIVKPGAQLSSPTNADHVGGRVALIGPRVTNQGTISTPDGQTILAAGLQVGMAAHSSVDATLRGLDVYVGKVADPTLASQLVGTGTATNDHLVENGKTYQGLIEAPRGNVTITGKNVQQLGFIESSTSVAFNGRVDLLADYDAVGNTKYDSTNAASQSFMVKSANLVELGPNSLIRILPELSSADRAVGNQLTLPSQVNIQGRAIHLASDAMIFAPGASVPSDLTKPALGVGGAPLKAGVNISAGKWFVKPSDAEGYDFFNTEGQVYFDSGATIDVSGSTGVKTPVSANIVDVQLRGAELADSPLQRNGALRGQTIKIDSRVGTPLADVSGYIGLVQRNVGELTKDGGTVSITAGDSVVMQKNATINVSGGWIDYQGDIVKTTQVISGGHIYDISQATPDRVYDGIYGGTFTAFDTKWGVSQTFAHPQLSNGLHYEQGYTYGGNGGAITISAPSMAIDGELFGNTVSSSRQRTSPPVAGTLGLVFKGQDAAVIGLDNKVPTDYSPVPPTIVFKQPNSDTTPVDAFSFGMGKPEDPTDLKIKGVRGDPDAVVDVSPDLVNKNGFGKITIDNVDGDIKIPAGVELKVSAGGSLVLSAANIDIAGTVTAPGGKLNFSVYDRSSYADHALRPSISPDPKTLVPDLTRGHFTLGAKASLNTAGLIIDDRPASITPNSLPLMTAGGQVTIQSYSALFEKGSVIDVSGGVAVNTAGKQTFGDAGAITIAAGQDLKITSILGGKLAGFLDADLRGYAGGGKKPGSLSILAPLVQIGGSGRQNGDRVGTDTLWLNRAPGDGSPLSADFFSQGGFGNFTINGLGVAVDDGSLGRTYLPAVLIASDTVIAPRVESWVLDEAGDDTPQLHSVLQPLGVRTPVNLTFGTSSTKNPFDTGGNVVTRGDIVMKSGAVITTDVKGNVILKGDTVAVLGEIHALGGKIVISGGDSKAYGTGTSQALLTVVLGAKSFLDARGTPLLVPDTSGHDYRTGSVVKGGEITVTGNILAEKGALLDVSGASWELDLLAAYSGLNTSGLVSKATPVPTRVESNGGSITLTGTEELFTYATLRGGAGGASAQGGSLTISSGRYHNDTDPTLPLDSLLVVTQSESPLPASFNKTGRDAIGREVTPAVSIGGKTTNPEKGHFAADSLNGGGFDSLSLKVADGKGALKFSGPVTISVPGKLSVGDGGVIVADSLTTLDASYVKMGKDFLLPGDQTNPLGANTLPLFGPGILTIKATKLIDIGTLSLQNIGTANFDVPTGDIRGDGTLDVDGNINLRAGQIYVPTAVRFNLIAYNDKFGGKALSSAGYGSVTIAPGTVIRSLPLSAGGTLDIFASSITQGGVLRAPIGAINLGWDGTGTAPTDSLTGTKVPVSQKVTLTAGSLTSVSAVDSTTGQSITIPYGVVLNGTSWIDPTGADITSAGNGQPGTGAPAKAINIAAAEVFDNAGSVIDLAGGGDLFAYRWVKGTGGSKDLLASSSSFAVIPGYGADYAPFAPYAISSQNFGSDVGYVNGDNLAIGDRVYLGASTGLPADFYTLLPARYALLPGAFLVTPKSGAPTATVSQVDGSSLVSGYRFNDLNATQVGSPLYTSFEIVSQAVVRARAQYDESTANNFLRQSAVDHDLVLPRLPLDAGRLVLAAQQAMTLKGKVEGKPGAAADGSVHGRGSQIDISSLQDILIAGSNVGSSSSANALVLSSSDLSNFGAESLLIGGRRSPNTTVAVTTNTLTVDNAGQPLSGPEVILVANKTLTIAAGADVEQKGDLSGAADTLVFGKLDSDGKPVSGSGDGVLLRVSSDPGAQIVRKGVSSATEPSLKIGSSATISGIGVTLDSTNSMLFDPTATLRGHAVALDSGRISFQLNNAGNLQPSAGLLLSGDVLKTLQASAQALSLASYSSIDIYGTGVIGSSAVESLALHAGEIRGFSSGGAGDNVTFAAKNIILDNALNQSGPGAIQSVANGTLLFDAGDEGTIKLGANQLAIDQYDTVTLKSGGGILMQGKGGLAAQNNLNVETPMITGETSANQSIVAKGAVKLTSHNGKATVTGGLGATLTVQGASVTANTRILLSSGTLGLRATSGTLNAGGTLDVSGRAQTFFDLVKYTGGGQISLASDQGSVSVSGQLDVSAPLDVVKNDGISRLGNAGSISVSASKGIFDNKGTLVGQGGSGGQGGIFSLDSGNLASTGTLDAALNTGGFTQSRSLRVRNGAVVVDGLATAHSYNLSADRGAIMVNATGYINASGKTGGMIALSALRSVILEKDSRLNVAGDYFDDAGKGGAVALETRGDEKLVSGQYIYDSSALIDIQFGSTIDLSVGNPLSTSDLAAGNTVSNRTDLFMGRLHLRAPQTKTSNDLQINPIKGDILGLDKSSSVLIEGYKVFDLTAAGGSTITSTVQTNVKTNGQVFASAANTQAILNRLIGSQQSSVYHVRPGAELINRTGDLKLDTAWDLSTYRFGPTNNEPGILTLRAAGNLNFSYNATNLTFGSLSDGFVTSTPAAINPTPSALWQAKLMSAGSQSYAYRLVSGADFSAADFRQVQPLTSLDITTGSLLLGKGSPTLTTPPLSSNITRANLIPKNYQVIRTGTGDIDVYAGRDVQLLNPLATIYTAGTQVSNPTTLFNAGDFDLPNTLYKQTTNLGSVQQNSTGGLPYPAQYSFGGGNLNVFSQNNIVRQFTDSTGKITSDSSMPTNWLYRRGYVASNGQFGNVPTSFADSPGQVASTSWWVDFSNFFEGVGALGGGNVSLKAGGNVTNVDAVVPTNARMPGKAADGKSLAPDASKLVELGGGDLVVRAAGDIDAGVYYVERGLGILHADGDIHTNATRAVSANSTNTDKTTWLPTTLFLGKGSFDVSANGAVLLGSVANPFLLPQGINNGYFLRTYFSTFAPTDAVSISSLGGDVTLKEGTDAVPDGSLAGWYNNVLLNTASTTLASKSQPWLRLAENAGTISRAFLPTFSPSASLLPGTLKVNVFSGSLNLVNNLTLSPTAVGTLDLAVAKSINGLQIGNYDLNGQQYVWRSSTINLSDADPAGIPGVNSPSGIVTATVSTVLNPAILKEPVPSISILSSDTGGTVGASASLQTKQALHGTRPDDAAGLDSHALHGGDTELNGTTKPIYLYAGSGDISGLTLLSAKAARVSAGHDITDVGLYLQNARPGDVSVVSAGRDLLAYAPNSPLRISAGSSVPIAQTGDIQISGPGTLNVFVGRNLDLGAPLPVVSSDGTGVGISSIGNTRNPHLPFEGANVVVGAGLPVVSGVTFGHLDFTNFIARYLYPNGANPRAALYLPELGQLMDLPASASAADIWTAFQALPDASKGSVGLGEKDQLALGVFYLVLRDAGRDHTNPDKTENRNYEEGYAAIRALFPGANSTGDGGWPNTGNLSLSSRSIQTTNGGEISLLAPGGGLTLGYTLPPKPTNPNAPPPSTPGIVTQHGGNIFSFTRDKVDLGVFRIFTLRGGNEIIWSSRGDIAAGISSKTVQAAPPTRVLTDPQSGDIKTDLAGLATGGGIGVLATVAGVKPGDVDLIAPSGTIDAGDAGIRSSGKVNVSAQVVVNASNIQSSAGTSGTPAPVTSSLGSIAAAASASSASTASTAADVAKRAAEQTKQAPPELPSIISVEILGYGGGDGSVANKKDEDANG